MTKGAQGSEGHCNPPVSILLESLRRVTYASGFDQSNALLGSSHRHEDQHNDDIRDRVAEDTGRVTNLDSFGSGEFDINVIWQRTVNSGFGSLRQLDYLPNPTENVEIVFRFGLQLSKNSVSTLSLG